MVVKLQYKKTFLIDSFCICYHLKIYLKGKTVKYHIVELLNIKGIRELEIYYHNRSN